MSYFYIEREYPQAINFKLYNVYRNEKNISTRKILYDKTFYKLNKDSMAQYDMLVKILLNKSAANAILNMKSDDTFLSEISQLRLYTFKNKIPYRKKEL